MTEPVENALRKALAAHASERTPRVDLDAVVSGSAVRRRRRVLARATVAVAGLAVLGLGVPQLVQQSDGKPGMLAGSAGTDEITVPNRLAAVVLSSLGRGAELSAPAERLRLGPTTSAELGTRLAGRARTAGARVSVIQARGGREWNYLVAVQSLRPAPTSADVRALAAEHAVHPSDRPLREQDASGRPAWIFVSRQGVWASALLAGGRVATIDVTSGARQPADMAAVAALLLSDLVDAAG